MPCENYACRGHCAEPWNCSLANPGAVFVGCTADGGERVHLEPTPRPMPNLSDVPDEEIRRVNVLVSAAAYIGAVLVACLGAVAMAVY